MAFSSKLFVASLLADDGSACASVGCVVRVDAVEEFARDSYDQVFTEPPALSERDYLLLLNCTVLQRVEIQSVDNPEAWMDAGKRDFLIAQVADYADAADDAGAAAGGALAADALAVVATVIERSDKIWMAQSLAATLLAASAHARRLESWEASELWQRYCATMIAYVDSEHSAERSEVLIDAAINRGGPLLLPVDVDTLDARDRKRVDELDARHADYKAQLRLHTARDFQDALESTSAADRLMRLAKACTAEAVRLGARAGLDEAFQKS